MTVSFATWLPSVVALGWTLLSFVWQGAVIGAAFGLARTLIPKSKYSARYAVSLVALALLALCPLVTLIISSGGYVDSVGAVAGFTSSAAQAGQVPEGLTLSSWFGGLDDLLPWLVVAWAAGVALTSWRAFHQWHALQLLIQHCANRTAKMDVLLEQMAREFGLFRKVRVLVSEHIDTPALIGWFKPVILLPAAVALGFPRHQIELVLAHELGHLRRHDNLVNLLQVLLETVLFYHPVVHWISREARNERELCCDALVLRMTVREPHEYARTLASLEELRHAQPELVLAATGGILLDRIRRIVSLPAPPMEAPNHGFAHSVVIVAGLMAAMSAVVRIGTDGLTLESVKLAVNRVALSDLRVPVGPIIEFPMDRIQHLLTASMAPPKGNGKAVPTLAMSATHIGAKRASSPDSRAGAAISTVTRLSRELLTANIGKRTAVDGISATIKDLAPSAPPSIVRIDADAAAKVPVARNGSVPVATRMISPVYPNGVHGDARIELGFELDRNGAVHDVSVLSGDPTAAEAKEAERALRQWRFDPATISSDTTQRFRQIFVFASPHAAGTVETANESCAARTGSHICRPPDADPIAELSASSRQRLSRQP